MAKRYKQITRTSSVEGTIDDAKSEIESLREEMSEWRDNLEDRLSGTDKYQQVSDCADALDQVCDDLDSVDLSHLPSSATDSEITYTETAPYGRKPQPRWMRLSTAQSMIDAAKSALEQARNDANDKPDCSCDNPPEDSTSYGDDHELDCPLYVESDDDSPEDLDWDSVIDSLDEALSNCDSVEFPGMY